MPFYIPKLLLPSISPCTIKSPLFQALKFRGKHPVRIYSLGWSLSCHRVFSERKISNIKSSFVQEFVRQEDFAKIIDDACFEQNTDNESSAVNTVIILIRKCHKRTVHIMFYQ